MTSDYKPVTIIVEGKPHEWSKDEYITYAQVVTLEVPDYPAAPRDHIFRQVQRRAPRQA